MEMVITTLSEGWSFKQTDDVDENSWIPVNRVPSTVHQDLIDNNKCVPQPQNKSETDKDDEAD